MRKQTYLVILVVLFGLVLRTYYPVTQEQLIGSDSYYHYRIAEYYAENQQLPSTDELYSGGRDYAYLPLFHVLLGEGYYLFGFGFLKAFPLMAYLAYMIVAYFIFRKWIPLFLLATLPVLLFKQAGYLLTDNLVFVFIALLTLFFLRKNIYGFFLTLFFYSLTHQSVLFFSAVFALISIWMMIRKRNGYAKFILACAVPHIIILFAFGQHVLNVSENVPSELVPMVYGFDGVGFFVMKQLTIPILFFLGLLLISIKKKDIDDRFWTYALLMAPLGLYAIGSSTLDRALAYSSIPIAYFSYQGLLRIKKKQWIPLIIVITLIFSTISAVLAVNELKWGVMSQQEEDSLNYLSVNCRNGAVMTYHFGHWITKYGCIVYADDIFDKSSESRFELIVSTFNLENGVEERLRQNKIKHIIVFSSTRDRFPQFNKNAENAEFIEKAFDNEEVQIYKLKER